MTSSPDRDRAPGTPGTIDPLPPALSSMWRLCKLGYRHEPRMMIAAFVLSQLAALPDALLALWLMLVGRGVVEHRPGLVRTAAIGLGVSAMATWFLRTVSTRVQRATRERSPCHGHRRSPHHRAAWSMGARIPAARSRAPGFGPVAHVGLGCFRGRIRRRGHLRCRGACRAGRPGPVGAGRRI